MDLRLLLIGIVASDSGGTSGGATTDTLNGSIERPRLSSPRTPNSRTSPEFRSAIEYWQKIGHFS